MDLSGAFHKEGLGDFGWLLNLGKLISLTLHNVQDVEDSLATICQLSGLQHLDVSQCTESRGQFKNPNKFMESLVSSLPKLQSLDISGTNLGGSGADPKVMEQSMSDILGLGSRADRPLQFLGLYKTHNDACTRQNIPAVSVSGDANESQILVAGQRYLDRPTVLESVLNKLFEVFRYPNNHAEL